MLSSSGNLVNYMLTKLCNKCTYIFFVSKDINTWHGFYSMVLRYMFMTTVLPFSMFRFM